MRLYRNTFYAIENDIGTSNAEISGWFKIAIGKKYASDNSVIENTQSQLDCGFYALLGQSILIIIESTLHISGMFLTLIVLQRSIVR